MIKPLHFIITEQVYAKVAIKKKNQRQKIKLIVSSPFLFYNSYLSNRIERRTVVRDFMTGSRFGRFLGGGRDAGAK